MLVILAMAFLYQGSAASSETNHGYCSFPPFLWKTQNGGAESQRKWLSKTEHAQNTDLWEKQKVITAMETELSVQHKLHASCRGDQADSEVPCFRQQIDYSIICISVEPNDKFRVRQYVNGRYLFTCLKFVQRNKNVIQVYSAAPATVNEDRLCHDGVLHREEWPWIVPEQEEYTICPFNGGFDFYAVMGDSSEELCGDVWQPSRMESECMKGEGITFYFPKDSCSPFFIQRKEQTVYCWASWQEESYTFIILAEAGRLPRYVLRLPVDPEEGQPMPVFLYFSLVVPLSSSGQPPGPVAYVRMMMTRSEEGTCYDESPKCAKFAEQGRCNDEAESYASHCLRSCALCDFAPSEKAECHFPPDYRDTWLLFGEHAREKVVVDSERFKSSALGTFICKSKHWAFDYYKVFSTGSNGCRPRFSCLHLLKADGRLQYRLSLSRLTDESFKLCQFTNDPQPLAGGIHSGQFKQLLPSANFVYNSCGLRGTANLNVTFSSGLTCSGTLSDVSNADCTIQSRLRLQLPGCERTFNHKWMCAGYFNDRQTGEAILVTRPARLETKTYICWILRTSSNTADSAPNPHRTYELEQTKCGAMGRNLQLTSSISHIQLESTQNRCVMGDGTATSYTQPPVIFSMLSLQPPAIYQALPMATNKNIAVQDIPRSTGSTANVTYSTDMRDWAVNEHILIDINAVTADSIRHLSTATQISLSVLFSFIAIIIV